MNIIIIFFLLFLVFQLMFQIIKMHLEIEFLKEDKELAHKRILNYKRMLDILARETQSKSAEISNGTIEAVHYAMIHNHPDNGGNAEKFVLYKKCYDKLIKQKNNRKGK